MLKLIIFIIIYLIIGGGILKEAFENIIHGELFDENFLMCVATIGAFCVGEYGEAVMVMLLYRIGEFFESVAVGKSRRNISALMDIRPDFANLVCENGDIVEITTSDNAKGPSRDWLKFIQSLILQINCKHL